MSYIGESFNAVEKPSANLSVYQCGYQISDAGHNYGPAVRDHYVIHYITKGEGVYKVNQRSYTLRAGQGFLILPEQSTSYTADLDHPWEYYWVGFHGLEAPRLLNLCHLGENNLIFSYEQDDRLKEILSDLHFASKQYASREFAMLGYLYLFFSCMIVAHENPHTKSIEEYFDAAVSYIADNYTYRLTVVNIAQFVGVERSYLHRIFKQRIGCSVYDYVQSCKMEQAKKLLRQGNLTVTEISNSLGFDSGAHFSKAFKQKIGIAPSRFCEGENGGSYVSLAIK